MSKWVVICNGGPNDRVVGTEASSIDAACGCLAKMMKALGASVGQIERADAIDRESVPVETEAEAGVCP